MDESAKLEASNAKRLLDMLNIAGLKKQLGGQADARVSKRYPTEDASTGPEAAAEYRRKHPTGRTSISNSARKLRRIARIAAGEAPLVCTVERPRERTIAWKRAGKPGRG